MEVEEWSFERLGSQVVEMVEKLPCGREPGVDELQPDFLKSLGVLVDVSLRHRGDNASGLADNDCRKHSNRRGFTHLSLPEKVY